MTGNRLYTAFVLVLIAICQLGFSQGSSNDNGDSFALYEYEVLDKFQRLKPQHTLDNTQDVVVTPYIDTYLAVDSNDCENTDSVFVEVTVLNLVQDTIICEGECVYMEGPPGMSSYIWYENDFIYSTAPFIEPCPIVESEYKLVAIDNLGDIYRDSTLVRVLPTPVFNLEPSDTTIFFGNSIELHGAVGNYTWEWWVADTLFAITQNIVVDPLETTTYVHYAFNSDDCAGVDSIIVDVSYQFLGPDIALCEGSCDSLHGPPGMLIYIWYQNNILQPWTTQSIEVCDEDTTEYALQVIDNSGGSYYDTVNVNVVSLPNVIIQPANDTISIGDSLELSVQDFYQIYQWYEEDTLLPDTTYSLYVHPVLDSVQYSVIVTDTNQCIGEDSTYVYVDFLSFDLGPDDTICQGDCYQLVGPPDMVVYQWYEGSTLLPDTTETIEVCPMETTMYTLWVENEVGATAEDSLTLVVYESPTVYFEDDTLRSCINANLELFVVASEDIVQYYWEFDERDSITDVNFVTFENIVDSAYAYVLAESENTCFTIDSMYVPVSMYPEITVTNDTTICEGKDIELVATAGDIYYWVSGNDTISTDSIVIVAPVDTTDYVVYSAYRNTSCFVSDTVTVAIESGAETEIIFSGDTTAICYNYIIDLQATGADSYIWIPSGDTSEIYKLKVISDTTVSLVGDIPSGCSSTDEISFTVLPSPEVYIEPLLPAYCIADPPVELIGNPEGGLFKGQGTSGGTFFPESAGPGEHHIWYEIVSEENGCVGADTTMTHVYGEDSEIDLGDNFTIIYTEAKVIDAGEGFDSYYWNTGATTQSITITGSDHPTGTYEYAVMGVVNGCSTPGSVFVTFEGPDNVNENKIKGLTLYPNPNTGNFIVEFQSDESKFDIIVYNLHGTIVLNESDIACKDNCYATVELTDLPTGIYVIKVITGDFVRTGKIILK